jgi:uncharacterized damage-inducible protein DinB
MSDPSSWYPELRPADERTALEQFLDHYRNIVTGKLAEDRDWPFHSSQHDSVDEVLSLYAAACARSRAAAGRFDSLDAVAAVPSFGKGPVNLRWILVHMIDETARHAGHLDLLRDAIDRGVSS